MSIQIIGAGLGRTGTLSLKAALEELGFTKCYHMVEVFTGKDDCGDLGYRTCAASRSTGTASSLGIGQLSICRVACSIVSRWRSTPRRRLSSVRDPDRWYDSACQTIYFARTAFPRWATVSIPGCAPSIGWSTGCGRGCFMVGSRTGPWPLMSSTGTTSRCPLGCPRRSPPGL